jgi:hypothetical protein
MPRLILMKACRLSTEVANDQYHFALSVVLIAAIIERKMHPYGTLPGQDFKAVTLVGREKSRKCLTARWKVQILVVPMIFWAAEIP